jgi:hypothetical protein
MANYNIFLSDPAGNRLRLLENFISLDYTLTTNGVSVCNLTLPGIFYSSSEFGRNYRIEVIANGILEGEAPFFIRRKPVSLREDGKNLISLTAFHANMLLEQFKIAYNADTQQSSTLNNEAADDLMKRITRDNIGIDSQSVSRDLIPPDISGYFSVESDTSQAPVVQKSFTRRKVIDVLAEIAALSYQAGTPLFFGIKQVSGKLIFTTKVFQWGTDRRSDFVISPEFGNLTDAVRTWDWSEEKTVGYALGSGQGASRVVQVATNASSGELFNWIEETIDARDTDNVGILQNEAQSLLKENRPKLSQTGKIQDTEGFRYGEDWFWGDLVRAEFQNDGFTAWINKVSVSIQNGKRNVSAILETVQ